jgi:hypothetical protein
MKCSNTAIHNRPYSSDQLLGAAHICLEIVKRRRSPFFGFGLVNQPALPEGWYLDVR